ncbi:bifunctional DNA-formamidopyrimidine glycosylase/DNA-(apurinic or apyrimidinic site) lyase [Pseudalkalibacillus caeni]|uniref:Formamidopyrimidine-DNA glycosylase n=1 Tax=Exobacillus caeni TaxID=2574798 RepID=A0A5R9EX64_9BACL|nr:bifunctional DNA-formamidopyrimidine glycosylase/DNA-(apurinic or apyrimidinic site) lyase [Pseudalkalibacillus caeni]TLS35451.1 bifunctional DNA-formamidopyrimidine glycosylase/DNA-(apurinic or apyrimidinic site) lyase [Pseudalkalibacillus caeni]
MPELPEMENYRRLLNETITGKSITKIEINREKSINMEIGQFQNHLLGTKIKSVSRRAKYLIFHLDSGMCLLLHLMLGGWIFLGNDDSNPDRTKQVILSFGNQKLYFIGLRLGYLHLLSQKQLVEELNDLGPEPLEPEFSFQVFDKLIEKRRGMLKTTLIDQKFISGIGNCYSDEICFEAKVLPTKKANTLSDKNKKALYDAIQNTLNKAVKAGGYMEEPFYNGDGFTGGYDSICNVYDREGMPCPRCGAKIAKAEISSRKTFYCKICQKE